MHTQMHTRCTPVRHTRCAFLRHRDKEIKCFYTLTAVELAEAHPVSPQFSCIFRKVHPLCTVTMCWLVLVCALIINTGRCGNVTQCTTHAHHTVPQVVGPHLDQTH